MKLILKHKIVVIVFLTAVAGGGYFWYKKNSEKETATRYITREATKGMLTSSISGSGQVTSLNQIEIKPKVSGDIIEVGIKVGQEVKERDILTKIDSRDAARKVNEARASLEAAKLELDELLSSPDKLSLAQAENAVASAQSNLDKLFEPVDEYSLLQAENTLIEAKDALMKLKLSHDTSYQQAIDAKKQADDNLDTAYENAYNEISNTFLTLPYIKAGLYSILYSHAISDSESSVSQNSNNSALTNTIIDYEEKNKFKPYLTSAENKYKEAEYSYDQNFSEYKDTSRYSSQEIIDALLEQIIETTKKFADAIKSQSNMLDVWVDYRTKNNLSVFSSVTRYQTELTSHTSKVNGHLSNLLSAKKSIDGYITSISTAENDLQEMDKNYPLELASAERNIVEKENSISELKKGSDQADVEAAKRNLQEKQLSLEKLKAGATEIEIRNKKISIQQKQNSLVAAQENYENYFIRAPFSGKIVILNIAKGDNVSSASAITTLATKQKIAEITLNEVDAAQVKIGQRAILTFDAIQELSITGKIAEIDTVGTVTQGVVSYKIKIAFDIQDERIKPSMSVSASIIIASKQDVLSVPVSAVKKFGEESYVEVLINGKPVRQQVNVGLCNDTMMEIIQGLEEGENVITQTISSANSNNAAAQGQNQDVRQQNNPMGGMFRIMR